MALSTEQLAVLAGIGLALGCSSKPGETGADGAPSECQSVPWTWENTGEPLMLTWCTSCHHSDLDEGERQGAPIDLNLETYADFERWADRVDARVWADSAPMPPAGGPTDEELQRLAEWMDCGAPE